ncbi:MAG TPA: response regulator [Verrucomicrobiae bacterium]|nr:response regulator [Verrucomicrobiae bacterium]
MARKILLADDSVTAQNMGRKILADAGYEVTTVNNGSAALKKIGETRPDLIVLDVYMPGYSGLEVCQRLKETQETSRIPVLLTVGKLEPFKPEEAKRVRADSFIVKPFEASELLSALTKLEDKIVPRAETSKPGRFARSIAAIEEGRYERAESSEEESGWKNRIAFPSRKKESAPDADAASDPAIYNAVNKDLRTVVDHSQSDADPQSRANAQVDVGALAAHGLPTDVTPEEIAALAAAAAQVKKSVAEKNADSSPSSPAAELVNAAVASAPVPQPDSSVYTQSGSQAQPDQISQDSATLQTTASTSAAPSEPFQPASTAKPAETEQQKAQTAAETPEEFPYAPSAEMRSEEPVTMAAAAAVGVPPSRWTAVAVALAPEESSLSLEAEMQAYAAPPTVAVQDAPPQLAAETTATAVAEPAPEVLSTPISELTQTFSEIADAAHTAVTAAVGELETAASTFEQTPNQSEAIPAEESSTSSDFASKQLETNSVETSLAENQPTSQTQPAPDSSCQGQPDAVAGEFPPAAAEQQPIASETEIALSAPQDLANEIPVHQNANDAGSTGVSSEAPAAPAPGGLAEMAKKESEIAANTAAAWASWRRIRESGDPHSDDTPDSRDAAAMAVAAGAEKSPEDASQSSEPESAEIASIVDSVLADLRPKIVEEISRKLGKKK